VIDGGASAVRRARRLVRCYPASWRVRYGDEFAQLLVADISERPRSLSRTLDVLRGGLLAHLAFAGLTGDALECDQQVRANLGAVGLAASGFVATGVALWSQLTIGWQWSAPSAPATRAGMFLMSAAMLACVSLAVLAAIPIIAAVCREVAGGRARRLASSLAAVGLGSAVLIVGSIHFGHGWPGTGGHPWAGRDLVPAGVARFCWAATLWITSYWAHPTALSSFPGSEIAWMVVSPIALLSMLIGAARTLRRLRLSSRLLRYESWLGLAAALTMAGFLSGAGSWVISGGPAPRGLFRVGAIDLLGIVVMSAAVVLAFRAARRALGARPGPSPSATV